MLIAGTLKNSAAAEVAAAARRTAAVRREIPSSLDDSAAALRNLHDDREIPDRAIDVIVDRLLKELTW